MQQNNYVEAEDAYRKALSIAPDNNKMCNLGICLMKQGRISEAKENLRRVKPAVADGPRGTDSHLKAYERAQQMLRDLESEMMNRGGDRLEQRRLFDAFLGSSSIWQPQPCKDHTTLPVTNPTRTIQDDFADENIDMNLIPNQMVPPPQQHKFIKPVQAPLGNSLNVAAQPFFSSKFVTEPITKVPLGNQFPEGLKRTRSGNAANSMRVNDMVEIKRPFLAAETGRPETKTRKPSPPNTSEETKKLAAMLPDDNDFEEAILAAVLGPTNEAQKKASNASDTVAGGGMLQRKIEKRLKVFQDITLSLSPRA